MELILVIIIIVYVALIVHLAYGIHKINDRKKDNRVELNKDITKNSFSIIIPFRDEALHINQLLTSLFKQEYPFDLYEVIMINDGSTDQSLDEIEKFKLKNPLLQIIVHDRNTVSNSPKKDAIVTGIAKSHSQWIVSTDADCTIPKQWLSIYNETIQKHNPKMMVGNVLFKPDKRLINQFQYFDLLSLQGVTTGSFGIDKPFMCNGANMSYKKDFFNTLNGFEDHKTYASGDDVFLLQKAIINHKKHIEYINNPKHIVITAAETNWGDIFNQRVRWAAKSTGYNSLYAKLLAIGVLSTNLIVIYGICKTVSEMTLSILIVPMLLLKISVDVIFISYTQYKMKQKIILKHLVISAFIYPFFNSLVGVYALVGNFNWKGRTFKS